MSLMADRLIFALRQYRGDDDERQTKHDRRHKERNRKDHERLERAKQKVADLLASRRGARTAVVAYAGSAHAVLPLTDDTDLVNMYLESLTPEVMPQSGDRPDRALELAASMLAR